MHAVALLWFTLLHALLPAGSLPAAGLERAVESVVESAAIQETRPSWTFSGAPSSRDALRQPARAAALLVSQVSGVVTPERAASATPLERSAHVADVLLTSNARSAVASRHYVVASRGDLLPYFPTAPPARL